MKDIITIADIAQKMDETTTIKIKTRTRDELRALGSMGDDYNIVIEKLILEHNRNKFVEYSRKIVEEHEDEFLSMDEL
ncbi:TPA: hypothetical protein HA351_00810 [Methanosarcinaceae archaeon]|nr:hypothetical protein [Methanosarcinaceae archaeon]